MEGIEDQRFGHGACYALSSLLLVSMFFSACCHFFFISCTLRMKLGVDASAE